MISSARDMDDIPKDVLKMDNVDYFAKPYDLGQFMERLGVILGTDVVESD